MRSCGLGVSNIRILQQSKIQPSDGWLGHIANSNNMIRHQSMEGGIYVQSPKFVGIWLSMDWRQIILLLFETSPVQKFHCTQQLTTSWTPQALRLKKMKRLLTIPQIPWLWIVLHSLNLQQDRHSVFGRVLWSCYSLLWLCGMFLCENIVFVEPSRRFELHNKNYRIDRLN